MSIVKDAFKAINLNKVPEKIALYEELCQNAEPIFELEGKKLEDACKEQSKNLLFFSMMLQECKTIEEAIRIKVEEIEGELFKKYNENNQRALGLRDIQYYIKGDPKYVAAYEILLEVVHQKRQLESVVEAIVSMGWSLGHIVKLRVAQLEATVL